VTIRALSAFPGLVLVEGGFRRRQVERILMIAGGSGMAPLLSMLANLAEKGNTPSRHLLLRARRLQDLYRLERNRELQAAMPVLEFVPVLSDEWPQDWSGESGLVSEAVARRMGSLEG
jgi:NAD(P)H-flavin reductase